MLFQHTLVSDGITVIGKNTFSALAITEVELPNTLTTIEEYAFYECDDLVSIEIPEGVKSIGNQAFRSCDALTSIILPSTLEHMNETLIYNCVSLKSIIIPHGVQSTGNSTMYCPALEYLEIPASVTKTETAVGYTEAENVVVRYLGIEQGTDISKQTFSTNGGFLNLVVQVPCGYVGTTFGGKPVTKAQHFQAVTGNSNLTYTASGDTITETCSACTGDAAHSKAATLSLDVDKLIYNGEDQSSVASVVYSENWLGGELDVTFSPAEVVNAGTYTASIACGGVPANMDFTIDAADASSAEVNIEGAYVCNGSPIVPDVTNVTVTLDGKILVYGTDYTFAVSNNVNAGTATLTVTFQGNYTGSATGSFTLEAMSIPALPETGDSASPMLWLSMSLLSMLGIWMLRKSAAAK